MAKRKKRKGSICDMKKRTKEYKEICWGSKIEWIENSFSYKN